MHVINVCDLIMTPDGLQWLEEQFLGFLADWEKSVEDRKGFSKAERQKMLLSPETRLGLRMTGMIL